MFFGRSKSRPRKFPEGISKLNISAPTPIDTININGGFIDLVKNPQAETSYSGANPVPPMPPTPSTNPNYVQSPKHQQRQGVSDVKAGEGGWLGDVSPGNANASMLKNQGGAPGHPPPTPRQLGAPPPSQHPTSPRVEKTSSSSSSVVNNLRDPRYPVPSPNSPSLQQPPRPPYQTEERATTPTGSRNFSRKLATPEPPSRANSDSSISPKQIVPAKDNRRERERPTIKTTDINQYNPVVPEISRPPSRGRRRDRHDKEASPPPNRLPLRDISPDSVDRSAFAYDDSHDRVTSITQNSEWERLREVSSPTGRNSPASFAGRSTPQSEKPSPLSLQRSASQSSSVYSGEQLSRVEDVPQQLFSKPQEPAASDSLRPKTPKDTLLKETNYFDSDFALHGFDNGPISPLLPSPPQRSEKRQPSSGFQEQVDSSSRKPDSPEPTAQHLPPLELSRTNDRDLYNLFSSDSEAIKNMPARMHHEPIISGPTSPTGTKLPSYLGPLQNVQTSTPITPMSPVERLQPKLGLGRKVSTRLRGLIGTKQRAPYDSRNAPSPEGSGRTRLAQISEPVPIPEDEREVDPEIERLKMRFDLEAKNTELRRLEEERALAEAEEEERQLEIQLEQIKRADEERTARRKLEAQQSAYRREADRLGGEQAYVQRGAHSKVDNWNYNPSASTSKSSLSEVISASEGPSVVSDPSDPGLSSHRSSVSKYGRDCGPASPITPADEFCFSVLRATETINSNSTLRQAAPSTIGKRSVEVPVFLCQDNDVPSFSHEPPTPMASVTRETDDRNSFMPSETEMRLEGREPRMQNRSRLQPRPATGNRDRSDSNVSSLSNSSATPISGLATPASSAPTSVPSSAPPVVAAAAAPVAKPKPPFTGGPKLLRSATMSSRPGGNKPLKKLAVAAVAAARLAEASNSSSPLVPRSPAPRPPTRSNSDQACERGVHSPPQRQTPAPAPASEPARQESPEPAMNATELYDQAAARERRHGPAMFSFAPGGFGLEPTTASSIFPDDSISCVGARNTYVPGAEPEYVPIMPPIPPAPKPTHVPSETDWQPQMKLRPAKSFADLQAQRPVQNNRVALLSGNLRVDTSVGPAAAPHSATEPSTGRSNTVKRSKSYGGGLRRAFSRRAPANPSPPSPPPVESPTIDRIPAQFQRSVPSSPIEVPPPQQEAQSGTLVIGSKHLRPRKGSVTTGKCTYCQRGPFANMWVCLDDKVFVVCRMCCNEMVTEQKAEIF